jgi:transcriptional regulator
MYLPAAFREDRLDVLHALMRAHPLAVLITHGSAGLQANPVPCHLDTASPPGMLRLHLARANPQLDDLRSASECLLVFQGPQAYISPSWYPSKIATGKVVPTWNYATVHAWGHPRVIDDPQWLRSQVGDLTHAHERDRPHPWAVDDAPADYTETMLRAIVGVEIPIARLEGKWKTSQNRSAPDRQGVVDGLTAAGDLVMARLVAERGAP